MAANWNLSVSLRGEGHDLARALRDAAKHARNLDRNAGRAKREVRELGEAAKTASRHLRTLGSSARTASRHLRTLGDAAQTAHRRLRRYGDAARTANRHLRALGDSSRTTSRQLTRMHGDLDRAIRDLTRLAQAAQRAATQVGRVGNTQALRRLQRDARGARSELRTLAAVMSGGALTMGLAGFMKTGTEYQQAMNAFGAVTSASAGQMQRAAATARELGGDLKLPNATAADAAESMVELAKAGFRTDQAISATRASLVLASAASVNAADSAKYLGDIMDQFGLGADQAARAADTLAATANSASGDIIDIYYSMKYAGPVAAGLGVTLQETASAVGMLGKAGILGMTAGTTLRGMFANLAAPTKQMTEGLRDMGIQAWDAQGNFKGLRYVIDGLSKAQQRMSQKDFAAAVKKSMGKPAMSGAIALAHQGVESFDALMLAVTQTGAASDIAAAKGKGLAGAIVQLQSKTKQLGLTIYEGAAPGLERLIRALTGGIGAATPKVEAFFKYLNDASVLFGPDVSAAARRHFGAFKDAASDALAPFKDLGEDAFATFLHLLIRVGKAGIEALSNLAEGAEPVIDAFAGIADGSSGAATALDIIALVLGTAADAAGALSGGLVPLGNLLGGLVGAFGSLPAPIQSAVLALLLFRRFGTGPVAALQSRVTATTGAFRRFGEEMAVQRALAASAGTSLSRYGAAMAVLQTRIPVFGAMASSFRSAATAGSGFAGTLRGITRAAGTGLSRALGGLTAALGGPWGLAIAGATVGLGMLASSQQKAAQKAAEHRAYIEELTAAMRESNGVMSENVRETAARMLQDKEVASNGLKLVDVARKAGISLSDLTDTYLGQGESIDSLVLRLRGMAKETEGVSRTNRGPGLVGDIPKMRTEYLHAASALEEMSGEAGTAAAKAKELDDAVKGTGGGVAAYDRLKDAVAALGDKTADADSRTRALREALDLLSGGSVSYEAAQARVNKAITAATDAMGENIDKSDGWGKQLVSVTGGLDTTTKNGQRLYDTLYTLADASSSAAVASYDFAQQQGKSMPQSLKAARGEISRARKAAIDLAMAHGMTKKQAEGVADAMQLIPGQVSILLQTQGLEPTLADLLAVQAAFEAMPDAKTVKVETLSEEARQELEDLGYKVELIPGTREYKITAKTDEARANLDSYLAKQNEIGDKDVAITAKTSRTIDDLKAVQKEVKETKGRTIVMRAPTKAAQKELESLGFKIKKTKGKKVEITVPTGGPKQAISAIQTAINSLKGKTVTVTTHYRITGNTARRTGAHGAQLKHADGGITDYYADGGITRQRGGVRSFARGAENHIAQIAPAGSWRVWAEPETGGEAYIPLAPAKRGRSRAIAEETVRRLGGGPVQWFADGGVTDWRYDPSTGSLFSPSDAGQAGRKTKKVKVKGKTKEIDYFDVAAVEKKLKSAAKATAAWNKDLERVADRVGGDVAEALAQMGEDGVQLAKKMANGSTRYINEMAKALRDLQKTAKASLTDYTRQLTNATKLDAAFAANLATLAARGHGDLARQLAAQNDQAAQELAAAAVKDNKKAAAANTAAKKANTALTADQVEQLVQIIAAIKTSKTGIHAVADTTGLGEDEIIAVANKARNQISKSLGTRAAQFLTDLARANKGLSYANGGIRAGMYATRGGLVRFAEPETGGEAYIPLGANKRIPATAVLRDVASRFGLGLTDAGAGTKVVVVRETGPLVGAQHWHITGSGNPAALARKIDAANAYQLRRLARGGVGAR
ncbi:MAG TPA: phage tail tape measure protein [Streptomyces sp.]|nr:phage tail tape measure protein [Streptomyces sp.]